MLKIKKALSFLKIQKWPAKNQWLQFFKVLAKKEKIAFAVFFILFLSSLISLSANFYFKNTKLLPAEGGIFSEGIIGQPRFINPVYAVSDVDRDLIQLIYSGLMKYNKDLKIIPDLAKDFPQIEEEGRIYKFYLKENLFWEDKKPLTADDIIFTIKTIQNPDFKSPFRANWIGVEVEKIGDLTIKFSLKKPYNGFLENCTLKILPKHIWENVAPENFPFEEMNLKATGSGPYRIKEIKQGQSNQIKFIALAKNPLYGGKKANVSEIKFLFFKNEKETATVAAQGEIKGLSLSSFLNLGKHWETYSFALPRYFAVFFNQSKSKILAEKEVRLALNYGTDKNALSGSAIDSPLLPDFYGLNAPSKIYQFDVEKAKKILEDAGFKDENGDGVREKTIKKTLAFEFKSDLKNGSQGKEVEELQKCLSVEITGYFGPKTKEAVTKFQEKYLIQGNGLVNKTTRQKLNEVCLENPQETLVLKISLLTIDQPQMAKLAQDLANQWKALGFEVQVQSLALLQLEQDFIKPRNYEALLFGEVLGAIADPLPFWHSTQKKDPGLNLALYENKKADDLLEENRKIQDQKEQMEKLSSLQDIIIDDAPAIFLYSPGYLYFASKEIKGISPGKITDPSKRFIGIENWYIKTKRVWK